MARKTPHETFEKLASGHCEAHVRRGNLFYNQLVMEKGGPLPTNFRRGFLPMKNAKFVDELFE